MWANHEALTSQTPGIGDRGRDPRLEGDRARDPVAALADAEQGDPLGVDLG